MDADIFELAARLTVDINDYERGLDEAEEKAEDFEENAGRNVDGLKGKFAALGKAAVAAIAAAAAGVGALVKSSVSAYGEYEQLVGGVQTIFKNGSDTVIANAKNAYKTAQMSAIQYMQTVTSFSSSLLQGIAQSEKKAGQMSAEEMSEMLSNELDMKEKANDQAYETAKKSYDKSYDALEKSLDDEIEAFQNATDKKIKEINKEYTEKLKLIDEEKYNKLKAIDDEIDAINEQAEAEKLAAEKSNYEAKKAELEDVINNSKKKKRREEAQKELDALEAEQAQKETDRNRKQQIESLKSEKEAIKTEYDAKKDALKEQQNSEIDALREAETAQLKVMRESKKEQLAMLKESNNDALKALKERYDEELKLAKKAAKEQLAALEESGGVGDYTEEQYQKAAEVADRAMVDIADNSNKMGTSMSSIMAAYQGFSKQNYTMLDNLKLGRHYCRAA